MIALQFYFIVYFLGVGVGAKLRYLQELRSPIRDWTHPSSESAET